MNDKQLWEELTSILLTNTKMHHSSIRRVATQLMPLLQDGARYRWIAADPKNNGALQWCAGKEQLDAHIDIERAKERELETAGDRARAADSTWRETMNENDRATMGRDGYYIFERWTGSAGDWLRTSHHTLPPDEMTALVQRLNDEAEGEKRYRYGLWDGSDPAGRRV